MFKKLRERLRNRYKQVGFAGVLALAIGALASAFGIDLAPAQVDAIVTALGVLAYLYREVQSMLKAERERA